VGTNDDPEHHLQDQRRHANPDGDLRQQRCDDGNRQDQQHRMRGHDGMLRVTGISA
jgi:hypothetical protein